MTFRGGALFVINLLHKKIVEQIDIYSLKMFDLQDRPDHVTVGQDKISRALPRRLERLLVSLEGLSDPHPHLIVRNERCHLQ